MILLNFIFNLIYNLIYKIFKLIIVKHHRNYGEDGAIVNKVSLSLLVNTSIE